MEAAVCCSRWRAAPLRSRERASRPRSHQSPKSRLLETPRRPDEIGEEISLGVSEEIGRCESSCRRGMGERSSCPKRGRRGAPRRPGDGEMQLPLCAPLLRTLLPRRTSAETPAPNGRRRTRLPTASSAGNTRPMVYPQRVRAQARSMERRASGGFGARGRRAVSSLRRRSVASLRERKASEG